MTAAVPDVTAGETGSKPVVALSFPPRWRVRKTDEYSSVFAFRKALRGRYFMLHYRPNDGESARLGLVVAKKLARRAVLRNLIKRMARETFRQQRSDLPTLDLILRLNAPAREIGRRALHADLQDLLRRLPR